MLDIANLTTQKIDKGFLQKAAVKALEALKQKNASVSLVLVGVGKIRQLNKTWRGRNRMTDVLAFAFNKHAFACTPEKKKESFGFAVPKEAQEFLGEIFICLPQAKKQAKEIGHSLKNELTLLLTHGILHLVGYEDEGARRQRDEMEAMQKRIVDNILEKSA